MSNMILLDTCEAIEIIKMNSYLENNGQEAFEKKVLELEREVALAELKFSNYFSPKFRREFEGFEFDEMLRAYGDYIQKEINECTDPGKRRGKFGFKNKFIKEKKEYYDKRAALIAAKILQRSIKGEVELAFSTTVEEELRYYVKEYRDPTKYYKRESKFSEKEYLDFTKKHITLIHARNRKIVELKNKITSLLSKRYPKKTRKVIREMSRDRNISGVYADLNIMAESLLAGMILVTENIKDFIRYKDQTREREERTRDIRYLKTVVSNNEYKRNNTSCWAEEYDAILTDALAYGGYEYLEGEYKKPTRKSAAVEIVDIHENQRSNNFKNEKTMRVTGDIVEKINEYIKPIPLTDPTVETENEREL